MRKSSRKYTVSAESLKKLYLEDKLSIVKISKILDIPKTSVATLLKEAGIASRPLPVDPLKNVDLTNKVFGFLTVLGLSEYKNSNKKRCCDVYWECLCSCGKTTLATVRALRTKHKQSCGCQHYKKHNRSSLYKGYKDISGKRFYQIKRGAEIRNLSFDITIEQLWELFLKQNRKCALSGLDISFPMSSKEVGTASLDRIHNDQGYSIGNVQWVHKVINTIKMDLNQDKFLQLCSTIHNHQLLSQSL